MLERIHHVFAGNGLITAFAAVGLLMLVCNFISRYLTAGRVHGSAIAIATGLLLSYLGGIYTGGKDGLADIALFSGMGLMGGSMLRDFAIVATAFGVDVNELKKSGANGVIALFLGLFVPFMLGGLIAYLFGYTIVAVTTIGAGAATYIVGPVTGTAIGAGSDLIALSIAIGLVKSISVMIVTPAVARDDRSEQSFGRAGLRRHDGYHQRRGEWPGCHRCPAGAVRRDDRDVLYRLWLPARPVGVLSRRKGTARGSG